jgi:hypothetical protein
MSVAVVHCTKHLMYNVCCLELGKKAMSLEDVSEGPSRTVLHHKVYVSCIFAHS